MKAFVLLVFMLSALFVQADETKVDNAKENRPTTQSHLSEKEKAYQAYLAKLEEENKQLEDDGFCSCNNN